MHYRSSYLALLSRSNFLSQSTAHTQDDCESCFFPTTACCKGINQPLMGYVAAVEKRIAHELDSALFRDTNRVRPGPSSVAKKRRQKETEPKTKGN